MARDMLIHEVGLRDGLQIENQPVPTEQKIKWIERLMKSGVDIIQLGSFVNPQKVLQMADTDELFKYFNETGKNPAGIELSGLVLNDRGLERGMACGAGMFCMGASASDTHSRRNTGMSTEDALKNVILMANKAMAAGRKVQVSVQSAFGCGFEGEIPKERVLGMVGKYLEAGARAISLADTAGHANPLQVEEIFGDIQAMAPEAELACHFHNTYGLGLANCYAAFRKGVRCFESAFAGLGGCPFTKVAAGNVCTEDLVHMLQRMNIRMDIDLAGLIEMGKDVSAFFGREMPGFIMKSGSIVKK